jgi:small-conductance mechanosensitive channel
MIEDNTISKIAFLFVAYVVISGGIIAKSLSCQFQKELETNNFLQHFIGILLIYMFIMMEGGWDFDEKENNKETRDWSNGNSLHSMVYAFIIYTFFILTSKMKFIPNMMFLLAILVLYLLSTQYNYWKLRESVPESTLEKMKSVKQIFIYIVLILMFYGIGDYYLYQQNSYGSKFKLHKFILGNPMCNYEKKK